MHPSDIKGILHLFFWYFEKEWIYKRAIDSIHKYAVHITLTVGLVVAGSYYLKHLMKADRRQALKQIANNLKNSSKNAKESLKVRLQSVSEEISKKRIHISSLSLTEIHQQLQDGILNPVEVLHAFQERALEADDRTNCITEIIFEAEDWAHKLESSQVKGPLYGIPFSIKDNFKIQGYCSTLGLAKNCKDVEKDDSTIVQVLKDLGAVPFVKTNIPQMLLSLGSSNPVWGTCSHPLNPERTSGGSSSGEAVLLSLKASILGIGTDFGGSIRFPCHACGVCGLKPTQKRIGFKNMKTILKGWRGVTPAIGPMTQDVDGLVLVWKAILGQELFYKDPTVVPIPFRTEIFECQSPLRIGFYSEDGFLAATPGCQRAVEMCKTLLESRGHELIPFQPPDVMLAVQLIVKSFSGDGGVQIRTLLKDEDLDDDLKALADRAITPSTITRFMAWVIEERAPKMSVILKASTMIKKPVDLVQLLGDREEYISCFIQEWQKLKLDAVICPAAVLPAPPHGAFKKLGIPLYTVLYNFLDFPCGVVPVTTETFNDQSDLEMYPTPTFLNSTVKEMTIGATGLPIGVQCVGLPWQEELCLRLMKEIEDGLQSSSS